MEQLITGNFQRTREFFERFNGRNRVSLFSTRDTYIRSRPVFMNIALRKALLFADRRSHQVFHFQCMVIAFPGRQEFFVYELRIVGTVLGLERLAQPE
jgi:hypothetical protein